MVDGNLIEATFTPNAGQRGDGISILGATDTKSNNSITATVSNNTIRDVVDDGISAGACGTDDTGSNNSVDVTIVGNTLQHFVSASIQAPGGVSNTGIGIFGSGGAGRGICSSSTPSV